MRSEGEATIRQFRGRLSTKRSSERLKDMPDDYDTSAEYLRSRVEQIAQEITQKVQSRLGPGQVQPFFICDIVNDVENAVNGVVNATQDAVNAAVNATRDAVNAAENIVERAVNIGERAINATEEVVHVVTVHTQQVVHVANLATDAIKVATFVTEFVGAAQVTEGGVQSAHGAPQASATELIQARRAAILQQRTNVINDISAKRAELKSKIAGVSVRVRSFSGGRGSGSGS